MTKTLRLDDFDRVVFFTGAGMSAESGVPTYRGKGGIWKEYDYEQYACQEAFERDPERVWEFHNFRRGLVLPCKPHRGHEIITEVLSRKPQAEIITQNIDGMHQLSGSSRVTELHGSLWRTRCSCGERREAREAPVASVRCSCGRYLRPDIVWFGDMLDERNVRHAMGAMKDCELLVSIGTSAVVYPAARMPIEAKEGGARLVEINPDDTPLSDIYDVRLRGPASEMLARLCEGVAVG